MEGIACELSEHRIYRDKVITDKLSLQCFQVRSDESFQCTVKRNNPKISRASKTASLHAQPLYLLNK